MLWVKGRAHSQLESKHNHVMQHVCIETSTVLLQASLKPDHGAREDATVTLIVLRHSSNDRSAVATVARASQRHQPQVFGFCAAIIVAFLDTLQPAFQKAPRTSTFLWPIGLHLRQRLPAVCLGNCWVSLGTTSCSQATQPQQRLLSCAKMAQHSWYAYT